VKDTTVEKKIGWWDYGSCTIIINPWRNL